ncbi:F-box protein [Aspergillus stella-maris]|uniref:F-box protein n=1 Tax=Aspergillus stella-maris TaxID=1810926 RepID=UPI003CCD32C8
MAVDSTPELHLFSLPNEVFVQILTPFTTHELLALATVSHRFHALVLRLLHYRLLLSASLTDYKLILECFHPTSKLTEPHVFCKYLGTPGLSDKYEGEGSLYENVDTAGQLGRLGSVYSIFRPVESEEEASAPSEQLDTNKPIDDSLAVRRPVSIEGFEDFSQLCVVVNVVKVIPGTDVLLSAVNVEDSVIRLFRDWLKSQVDRPQNSNNHNSSDGPESGLLWVDRGKNVALRFSVREVNRLNSSFPVLVHRDEESFSSYEISIDELHVRTTRLLLTVEQSLREQQSYPKAVVFTAMG